MTLVLCSHGGAGRRWGQNLLQRKICREGHCSGTAPLFFFFFFFTPFAVFPAASFSPDYFSGMVGLVKDVHLPAFWLKPVDWKDLRLQGHCVGLNPCTLKGVFHLFSGCTRSVRLSQGWRSAWVFLPQRNPANPTRVLLLHLSTLCMQTHNLFIRLTLLFLFFLSKPSVQSTWTALNCGSFSNSSTTDPISFCDGQRATTG